MSSSTAYQIFLANTFAFEGGFDQNPHDRGNWTGGIVGKGVFGGTRFGISSATYASIHEQLPDVVLPGGVAHLTRDQAEIIYKRLYWDAVHGDELPWALALVLADDAVNGGVDGAIKRLQHVFGINADGVFGPETLRHAKACEDGQKVILSLLLTERIIADMKSAQWGDDGEGWLHRVTTLALFAGQFADLTP